MRGGGLAIAIAAMAIRLGFEPHSRLAAALLASPAATGEESGPIAVSAIGAPPRLANPNLQPLDPPAAFLTEALAQGLVRFDAAGEIEPALAQSWIVSDDGLRYTFRHPPHPWAGRRPGHRRSRSPARLRAALSRASRNPLKPVLGAIENVVADDRLRARDLLRGPRPNFLQLLAHPELAIIQNDQRHRPLSAGRERAPAGVRLALPRGEDEEPTAPDAARHPAARRAGGARGRPLRRRADRPRRRRHGRRPCRSRAPPICRRRALVFDPVAGLFGLAFAAQRGAARRSGGAARAGDGGRPRRARRRARACRGWPRAPAWSRPASRSCPAPAQPDWAARRCRCAASAAARAIAALGLEAPLRLRVAMPDGPGYRLVFAHLRRDWRMIGVEAERVAPGAPADLRLIDQVAPANLASWYLRHFTCDASAVCDAAADQALLRRAARARARPTARRNSRSPTGYLPSLHRSSR